MSVLGDLLNKITGKKPEQPKPAAEAAKPTPPAAFRITNNVPEHRGPAPSPTARLMDKMPDVKAQAKAVYDGVVPPKPGPLNQPPAQTAAATQQPTRRPTENTPQPRPPGGPRPGPTVAAPGTGGTYSSARTPQRPTAPAPAPAQQPAARKPLVKTFEQFIGAGKPGHKL